MPVLREVIGRLEDCVYGLDGRRLVRFHGIFVDQPHVREGQIVQEALDASVYGWCRKTVLGHKTSKTSRSGFGRG